MTSTRLKWKKDTVIVTLTHLHSVHDFFRLNTVNWTLHASQGIFYFQIILNLDFFQINQLSREPVIWCNGSRQIIFFFDQIWKTKERCGEPFLFWFCWWNRGYMNLKIVLTTEPHTGELSIWRNFEILLFWKPRHGFWIWNPEGVNVICYFLQRKEQKSTFL